MFITRIVLTFVIWALCHHVVVNATDLNLLMVGNSYTKWWGGLDQMIQPLMEELYANDIFVQDIYATKFANGGFKLSQWVDEPNLDAALTDETNTNYKKWTWVTLQDQSQVAGFHVYANFEQDRITHVVALNDKIERNGASTVLFLTWARRDGDMKNNPDIYPDFLTMQEHLTTGKI